MSRTGRLLIDGLGIVASLICSTAVGFLWLFIMAGIASAHKGKWAWMGGLGEYVLLPDLGNR
jgi:hypothetical protein